MNRVPSFKNVDFRGGQADSKRGPIFRLRWSEVAPQKGEDRSINKFLAESSCVFKRIVL